MTGAFCYPIESLRRCGSRASFGNVASICERHGSSCTKFWAAAAFLRGVWKRRIPGIGSISLVKDEHEARPDVIVGCWPCVIVPSVQCTLKYDGKLWAHSSTPLPRFHSGPLQSMALTCSLFHQYRSHVYNTTHNLPSIYIEALNHRRWHGGSEIHC